MITDTRHGHDVLSRGDNFFENYAQHLPAQAVRINRYGLRPEEAADGASLQMVGYDATNDYVAQDGSAMYQGPFAGMLIYQNPWMWSGDNKGGAPTVHRFDIPEWQMCFLPNGTEHPTMESLLTSINYAIQLDCCDRLLLAGADGPSITASTVLQRTIFFVFGHRITLGVSIL